MFSPVVSDQFNVTDRFRIDGAVRYELQNYFQTAENTSNVDLDGNLNTVYDIETFGNNTYRRFDFTLDDFAGSVGVNYQLKPNQLALYGSFNRGFLMPALDEFMFEPSQESVNLFEPRKTNMFEGGVKYSSPYVGFTATGFYGKLYNITSRGVEFDVNGNPVFVTRHAADVTSWGFEGEVLTRPLHNFEFRASGTVVDNKLSYPGLTLAAFDFTVAYIVAGNARISFDTHYVGERVTSPIGAPQIVTLPSFAYIDLGGTYRFSTTGFTMGVGLLNLTNSQGFEEGDPRNDPNRGLAQNIFNARPLLPFRVVVNGRYDW